MQVDVNKLLAELSTQRNQAFDAHAVASARAGALAEQLAAAEDKIAELQAIVDANPAAETTLPDVEN